MKDAEIVKSAAMKERFGRVTRRCKPGCTKQFLILLLVMLFSSQFANAQELRPIELKLSEEMRSKLTTPLNIERVALPLKELVVSLENELEVSIDVDDFEVDILLDETNPEFEFSAKGRTLAQALTAALEPHNLDWSVRDGAIWITSPYRAQDHLFTVSYDVSAFALQRPKSLLAFSKFETGRLEKLIDLIQSEVSPDNWQEVGGAGSMVVWDSNDKTYLFVSQSVSSQLQVRTLMERIQSMDFKVEAGRRLTESTHFVQVYPLSFKSDQDPEELVAVIKEMIVDDWNDNDADVRVVGQGLVLKQTWDNQLRVRDFLEGTEQSNGHHCSAGVVSDKPRGKVEDSGLAKPRRIRITSHRIHSKTPTQKLTLSVNPLVFQTRKPTSLTRSKFVAAVSIACGATSCWSVARRCVDRTDRRLTHPRLGTCR